MQLNPNWSQVGKAERALIMLASFDAWTLEEVAYLSAGILPPGECVIFRVQGKFIGGAEQFAPLLF